MTHPFQTAATYPVAELERRFQAFAFDRLLSWSIPAGAALLTWLVAGDDVTTIVAVGVGTLVLVWLALAIVLGVSGTSPGKSLTGLRVVHDATGSPIGVGPALLRSSVLALSGLPTFGIGVATLAWTAVEDRSGQRRGWHDHVARSVVVDVRPAPVVEVAPESDAPRHIVNLTAMRLIPAPPVEAPPTPVRSSEHSVRRQPTPTAAPTPAPVPAPVPTEMTEMAVPRTRWRVRFDQGEDFIVEGLVLVGRRPESRPGELVTRFVALTSGDMSVSKTHAQVGLAPDGGVIVMDRGSTNGTTLVRQGEARKLTPGRTSALLDGDRVLFGDREMSVAREG